jgi:CDP-4-dehydro-6-deoxyglucose reductase, E1
MNKTFTHKLMNNNISRNDINVLTNFLKKKNIILTQSKKVQLFEKKWSKWLGVKYSVFCNSGSSANIISITILKNLFPKGGEIIVPTLTWVSDIAAVIMNGFVPIFVDININNLSASEGDLLKKINKKTVAVFLTHAQGFNGLTKKILDILKRKKIFLIEDVCESHGAKFKNKKLGTFGDISNFSFYYAHHMTTIEGGMVCTNNKNFYHAARMLRSHGMHREIGDLNLQKKISLKYPKLSPNFIFLYPGFNMRNNEIGAVLGMNQLKKLDANNKKRNRNFFYFLSLLNKKIYFTDFQIDGVSNYAFPLILKKRNLQLRDKLEKLLSSHKIEFRRGNAGGGNQLRQPYLKNYIKKINFKDYPNVEHVHFFGYYIGNYPELKLIKIKKICKILNKLSL